MAYTLSKDQVCDSRQSNLVCKRHQKAIPEAKQIADRFHLVENLSDTIQEEIRHEYSHLKQNYRNSFEATNFEKNLAQQSQASKI